MWQEAYSNPVSKQFQLMSLYLKKLGPATALRLRFHDAVLRHIGFERELELRPHNALYPVKMRTGRESDREVFHQIFIEEEYALLGIESPSVIVDLGANVGYSSAFFLSRFPNTKVISVEPESGNFRLCQFNLEHYGARSVLLHGGIWSESRWLAVKKGPGIGDGRAWAAQVAPENGSGEESVTSYTMQDILKIAVGDIDWLKIDIEGSERDLFARNTEWLDRVTNICIEIHGQKCGDVFFEALSDFDYDLDRCCELAVCKNLRRKEIKRKTAAGNH
jgi:FkbM family methyltransferase